jgi:hypothetical protein
MLTTKTFKLDWKPGQIVQIDHFPMTVLTPIKTAPGAADAYVVYRNEHFYKFAPLAGLKRIDMAVAREFITESQREAERKAEEALEIAFAFRHSVEAIDRVMFARP